MHFELELKNKGGWIAVVSDVVAYVSEIAPYTSSSAATAVEGFELTVCPAAWPRENIEFWSLRGPHLHLQAVCLRIKAPEILLDRKKCHSRTDPNDEETDEFS
jgi:hypothetical protein